MNIKLSMGVFLAAGMLLATSCSKNESEIVRSKDESKVTFSLGLEGGIGTRAISDGTEAKKLIYAVYNANGELIQTIANADVNGQVVNNSAFSSGLTENVSISLAKGQQYTVAFWAQNPACTAYNTNDLKNVTVSYNGVNNDESRDAFFRSETFTVTSDAEIDVTLKRPFAQINVGVTEEDWNNAKAAGVEIESSAVVIKNAATSINLLDGSVSGETEVSYGFAAIPAKFATPEDLSVTVGNTNVVYKWLSMCYILVNDENGGSNKATLESDGLQFTFKPASGSEIVFDEGLNSVPVQRNWRTNILGKLLTGEISFNITIDPIYSGEYNSPDFRPVAEGVSYDEATSTFFLSSKAGLAWFADQTNTPGSSYGNFTGKTVKLTTNVDLSGETWIPIGTKVPFCGAFDGGNNTISNLTVNVTDDNSAAGLFATALGTVKNVKLSNVDIKGHYKAAAVVGDAMCSLIENCHVEGGSVTSTPNSVKDNANHVGGIAGYLSAEPNAWVKNCSVKNLTVTAYRNVGGIVGSAMLAAVVSGNSIDNVKVIANQLVDYIEPAKADDPGKVVGRDGGSATIENNTVNNVTVTRQCIKNGEAYVGTDEGISYAINEGVNTINLNKGIYIIPDEAKNKTLTFVGTGNPEDTKIATQDDGSYERCDYSLDGATVTFENVSINTNSQTYTGYARCSGTYKNCVINGTYTLYGDSVFENCTFNVSGNFYNIWTWGAKEMKFSGCTFNSDGKALLLYQEGTNTVNLTVENCVFNDKGGLTDKKAAIEIGDAPYEATPTYNVTISKTVVNGYEINDEGINTGTTLWGNKNSMPAERLNVTVDGVNVY